MKRFIILLAIIAAVITSCQKNTAPVNYTVSIASEKINNIDPTSVVITGTYSYPGTLDGIQVLVGESSGLTDAATFYAELSGKNFTVTLTNLKGNTKYYYKYRFVSMGATEDAEATGSFTTLDGKPEVTTLDVTSIMDVTAICGGNVSEDYGFAVTERGICWSTSDNPTVDDNCNTEGGQGTGSFYLYMSELTVSTTYYVRAYARNENGVAYGEPKSFKTYDLNGHAYVDLGLPSGTLWATCNVGASNPEDYGGYFAWGETTTKSDYGWDTYKWCNGSSTTLTKYNTESSYGTVDNKTELELSDDAARANWGGNWRMPTYDELVELKNNCTWTWATMGDKSGYRVANKSDNSKDIFLPAAGYYNRSSLSNSGSYGYYWSSSLNTYGPYYAYYLYFSSSDVGMSGYYRRYGQSVRPVCPPQN